MKKLIAIVSFLFLLPFTAMALTPMQDDQMSGVTGQAGVSISVDAHVDMHIDTVAWGDSDGATADDAGGWVGASDVNGSFFVGLRSDHSANKAALDTAFAPFVTAIDAVNVAQATYDANPNATTLDALNTAKTGLADAQTTYLTTPEQIAQYNAWIKMENINIEDLEVLTIDVGSSTAYNTYSASSDDFVTYVRIGLGTFEFAGDMDMDIEMGAGKTLGQELGTLDIQGMVVRGASGGYVDITTEGRSSGVTLAMNVLLDQITIDSLAWGDTDGADNIYDNDNFLVGGYVGLANLYIDNLNITGKVGIDVVTFVDTANLAGALAASTDYKEHVMAKLAGLMTYNSGDLSDTQVILSLGDADGVVDSANDLYVTMGAMYTDVALGATNNLNASDSAVMGSIYMAGVQVTVDGLVGIAAH